jgi:hypothetical protein
MVCISWEPSEHQVYPGGNTSEGNQEIHTYVFQLVCIVCTKVGDYVRNVTYFSILAYQKASSRSLL